MNHVLAVTVVILAPVLGCGKAGPGAYQSAAMREAASGTSGGPAGELNLTPTDDSSSMAGSAPTKSSDAPRHERKIIFNATLDVVVENIADVASRVEELARKYDGFISKSSIDTASGRPRHGSWTIRVPAARYDEFLNAAGTLGELQRRTEDSREVTAEYYDLETRIRNKQVEEERLLKHLADSTGKLEDILAVEKELSRVRTEVEQMQGQMRVLQDLTALSTVTLNAHEILGYVPKESPTFGTQLSRSWQRSVEVLAESGKFAVIAAVAFAPWLVVIGVPLVVALLLHRWWLRRKRGTGTRP